jgi:hypothetical protein
MQIEPGIYKVFSKTFKKDKLSRRLEARLLVHPDGTLTHLEAHGTVDEMLPEGQITDQTVKNWDKLAENQYISIERE